MEAEAEPSLTGSGRSQSPAWLDTWHVGCWGVEAEGSALSTYRKPIVEVPTAYRSRALTEGREDCLAVHLGNRSELCQSRQHLVPSRQPPVYCSCTEVVSGMVPASIPEFPCSLRREGHKHSFSTPPTPGHTLKRLQSSSNNLSVFQSQGALGPGIWEELLSGLGG